MLFLVNPQAWTHLTSVLAILGYDYSAGIIACDHLLLTACILGISSPFNTFLVYLWHLSGPMMGTWTSAGRPPWKPLIHPGTDNQRACRFVLTQHDFFFSAFAKFCWINHSTESIFSSSAVNPHWRFHWCFNGCSWNCILTLKYADVHESRNLFIVTLSMFTSK